MQGRMAARLQGTDWAQVVVFARLGVLPSAFGEAPDQQKNPAVARRVQFRQPSD